MKYEVLKQQHRNDALELVLDAFLDRKEPVIYHFRDIRYIFRKYLENEIKETIESGLSAVVLNNDNQLIGVCLNKDFYAPNSEWKKQFYENLKEIGQYHYFDLLHKLVDKLYYNSNIEADIKNSIKNKNIKNIGNVYYISYIATSKLYLKQGISTKLLNYCLKNIAIQKGYKYWLGH